jgi:putative tricarboxylic transport membrane protein
VAAQNSNEEDESMAARSRFLRGVNLLAGALGLLAATQAWAQSAWRAEKATEFVISTAIGGSNDQVARLMQRILQDQKILANPTVIINKPGGNQTLAVAYLNQHPGDSHFLLMGNPTVVTNPLNGIAQVTVADMTPVALLLVEHTAISVKADSPIRNLRDLTERLKADPESMAVGTVAIGGVNHLALILALKAGGVDVKRVKMVIFKTNAESMTAMVGGHIHLVSSSVSSATEQVKAGNARTIAVAAQQRLGGAFVDVATFREQGIENWVASWRGMIAPKGTPAAQVASGKTVRKNGRERGLDEATRIAKLEPTVPAQQGIRPVPRCPAQSVACNDGGGRAPQVGPGYFSYETLAHRCIRQLVQGAGVVFHPQRAV